jgi:uncharacterized protein YpbB
MADKKTIQSLLDKVEKTTSKHKIDLSSAEDLSVGVMNLISIEEHLFFSAQKTGKPQYLELLNEVRTMRTELMKEIIKDYEGEVWCVSKHLLSASMRLIEVGTKELKKGDKKKAWYLFEKAYKLYSLFWGINLDIVRIEEIRRNTIEDPVIDLIDEGGKKKGSVSVFDKLGAIIKKAVNCCKE